LEGSLPWQIVYSSTTTYPSWGIPLLDLDQKDFWKWLGGGVGAGAALKVFGKLLDYWRPTKKQEIEADEAFLARVMARCLQLEAALDKTHEDHRIAMRIVHEQYEARLEALRAECQKIYAWAIRRGYDPEAKA
jgi:Arc/MetJ family transcription regulator